MFQKLTTLLQTPTLYAKTSVPFWDDEHISRQMLKAHLNPDFEGASRKLEFIGQSVHWIAGLVPPSEYTELLDLGCGPGIYAERFTNAGYQVTGIDFSKRSIDYATQSATEKKLNIRYLYQNYLELDLQHSFDFAAMIYCDYGALSTADRKIVMQRVYEHLKPGGRFLLDVFSMAKYHSFKEEQTWEFCRNGGFWSKDEYLAFHSCRHYSDCVTLEQTSVVSKQSADTYYIWNTYFTKETFLVEALAAGFQACEIFSDVAGKAYCEDSPTIAFLLQK